MPTKTILVVLGTLFVQFGIPAQTQPAPRAAARTTPKPAVKYGSNPAAGKTFTHEGVKL